MDSKTYLQESERTASKQFHANITPANITHRFLQATIRDLSKIDKIKKNLFYGKEFPCYAHDSHYSYDNIPPSLIHGIIGILTEASELAEALSSALEGNKIDLVNIQEEMGDIEWYMAMLYRELEKTPAETKQLNINKLQKRYPEKFTSALSDNRDTEAERKILENGHNNGQ